MNKSERCLKIMDLLEQHGQVEVNELAAMFATSEMTIRRDLNDIAKQYNVTRTYGGAVMPKSGTPVVRMISFDETRITHREAKEKIAHKAASMIGFRQRIFIDAGSTTREIVNFLNGELKNVIVTNNIGVVERSLQYENVSVIMIGGEMIRISQCSSGAVAEAQMKNYQLDMAFIGAAAVGADGKLYDGYSPEARLKKSVFDAADEVYLLVDSSKFNTYDLNDFGRLDQVKGIITDADITEEGYALLKKHHVDVIIAE